MRKGSTLRNRIFRLRFPHDDGPRAQLLPNKLGATEYLSREFECSIELLSDNPNIALKEMQGKLPGIKLISRMIAILPVARCNMSRLPPGFLHAHSSAGTLLIQQSKPILIDR